jgi:Tetratricopeptide repeat
VAGWERRVYSEQSREGQHDDAERLRKQVLEVHKRVLGPEHPSTLTSMANLAFTWKARGRHTEAIGLMRHCVQQRQSVLGASHPRSVQSWQNGKRKWLAYVWRGDRWLKVLSSPS